MNVDIDNFTEARQYIIDQKLIEKVSLFIFSLNTLALTWSLQASNSIIIKEIGKSYFPRKSTKR